MTEYRYRKSSYSDQTAECVEVATNIPATIAIRDSKTPSDPPLRLHPAAWETFRTAVTADRLR
ncbi:DUF397 domain-containing protein [Streptomyces sp. ME02-8801-2C]|uniref:DUF397 domain-containing protein n=1 Tax=Streptomyces sp. ME02-8801-2C TaxID=3028680 RepID=UPI0029B87D52|nr:DUF397 domain-containing protein [Streptomyces sp. ME02-8801-2C]MDX3453270.1 DUF397 domain-containing protein [Streptomyces sp. ME02-8801-2C]